MEDKTAEVNTTSEVQPAPDPALLRPDTSATSSFPSLELRQPSDASDASTLRPGLHSESSVAGASSSQASSTRSLLSSFSRPGRIFRKAGTGVKRQGSANGPTPLSASLTSTLWPVWSDSHKHDIDSRPDFAKTLDALGYPESLKREHDAWSLGAISLCNIGFLQGSLFGSMASLRTGGSSMLSIGWPLGGIFMVIFTASIAEFGSAYPYCGAMFTWVWKLCRTSQRLKNYARFLSWLTGSLLLCGHVLTQILISFQFAVALQGTARIYSPGYEPGTWNTILIAFSELLVVAIITSFPISRNPLLWKAIAGCVIALSLITVFSLLGFRKAPISAAEIFTTYRNETGWSSRPYVYLIGWVQTTLAFGQDVTIHLAEETKNPEKSVPLACFWSVVITYGLGWMVICVLLGSAPHDSFIRFEGQIFSPAQILLKNLPKSFACAILVVLLIAMLAQGTAQLLASSRFAFALARDKAVPCSHYISRVSPRTDVPYVAVWTVVALCIPGLLLTAASSEFVETLILAGAASSTVLAYALPCLIYLTLKGTDVLDGGWRWTLRSFSKPAAAIGVVFAAFILAVLCLPRGYPVDRINLGWAPITVVIVIILSTVAWAVYGNANYAGPIKILLGPQIELPHYSNFQSTDKGRVGSEAFGRTVQVEPTSDRSRGRRSSVWTASTDSPPWNAFESRDATLSRSLPS